MPYTRITPQKNLNWNESRVDATSSLENENGGRAHIVNDDHCYVLLLEREGKCEQVAWWFREAIIALRDHPLP